MRTARRAPLGIVRVLRSRGVMHSLRALGCLAIVALVMSAAALGGVEPAHADLRGARDVTRALTALADDEDDARRTRAGQWLATHGTDDMVMPALLSALHAERDLGVADVIARAIARHARPSDAAALLLLEPTLRSPARATIALTIAQLDTEQTDAWVLERLASPAGSELRTAMVEVAELARRRRDVLLPRVLDAIAQSQPPLLVAWLASLEDERARATLLALVGRAGESGAASTNATVALEGLAQLGPDAATARALEALLAAHPLEPRLRSPELARALLAADPEAEVSAMLDAAEPALRTACLEALLARAPHRAIALLGADPAALEPGDAALLEVAIGRALAEPSEALTPWLEASLHDTSRPPDVRADALEALVRLPRCGLSLAQVELDEAPLADARLSRVCAARPCQRCGDGLHLRAIAGEDVLDALAHGFAALPRDERLERAHGWLASRRADPRVLDALEGEPDAEIVAVLALAALAHGLETAPGRWTRRLEHPDTSQAALALLGRASSPPSPSLLREIGAHLRGPSGPRAALALHALARHSPASVAAFACANLESSERVRARAGLAVLRAQPHLPTCVSRRARVDAGLRRVLAEPPATARDTAEAALVVRVSSNVAGPPLRVAIETRDGLTFVVRPPPSGLLVVPGLGASDVTLRLEGPSDR